MMIKVAVAKTLVQEALGTELHLVATQFQECVSNQWIDITADVDYTQTADAVVEAVLQDPNAGQTAGKATVTAQTVELTLGPFGAKARLNLTFEADRLCTYDAMSTCTGGADMGSLRLLPLWINLPFAPVHDESGLSNLAVRLQAPVQTTVLPVDVYQEAYWHLKNQDDQMKAATVIAVSDLTEQNGLVGGQFQWESLPPRSTGLLAWLALPNKPPVEDSIFDFVHIGRSLEELGNTAATFNNKPNTPQQAQVTVQVPQAMDATSLQVPLPGHGPMGSLCRLKVQMPQAQPRQQPYLILNLTLSDKSGSTGMRVGNTTMRDRFNRLAEARFLKRLESIPALVKASVLKMEDIWMEAFLAFDSSAPAGSIRRVTFRVGDVHDSIAQVVQALRSGNDFAANLLPSILQHVQALRGVTPGGATDFSVGPRTLVQAFETWQREANALSSTKLSPCAFVEFDTDGGHNRGNDYITSLKNLCEVYDVRDGVVTGFGSWLNQDCATKVARVLGSVPALLALQVPEPGTEGLNKVFRTGFSAWISALRKPPNLTLKLSAGAVSFPSPVASRNANAVEVLGFRRIGERRERLPKFGALDVSNETYTKAVVTEIPAGEELLLYVVSRLPSPTQLEQALDVQTIAEGSPFPATSKGNVGHEDETSAGSLLAYDWLTMLTNQAGNKSFQLAPLMESSLSSRLEDEVSFRFNVASPSGKTSFLGRCKTVAGRASIDAAHQPDPPACPIKILPPKKEEPLFRAQAFGAPVVRSLKYGDGASPFGGTASNGTSITTFSSGPEVTRSAGFGFGGGGTPFGAPAPSGGGYGDRARGGHNRRSSYEGRYGGGSGGGGGPGGFGGPAPQNSRWSNFDTGGGGGYGYGGGHRGSYRGGRGRGGRSGPGAKKKLPAPEPDTPKRSTDPSWRDVLAVPVGSDTPLEKQDYGALLDAVSQIVHARQRLQNDPTVNFVCDICNRQFSPGEPRYHCYDCQDFDACGGCKDGHNKPFHRISTIGVVSVPAPQPEDPLVSSLLQQPTVPLASQFQAPNFDQTKEWCKLRVRRFLLGVLHWWPVFRATCTFREKLPASLGNAMAEQIVQSFNGDNLIQLLETVTIVVDSLMREDAASRSPASPSNGYPGAF